MQHPLFMPDDAEGEWADTGAIYVRRKNPQGAWEKHPHAFAPEELPDLETVSNRWGGGCYEFIGRTPDNSAVAARATHTLAGRPRPLIVGEEPAPAGTPGAPPVQAFDPSNPMAMMMAMSQQGNQQMMAIVLAITQTLGTIGAAIAGRPPAAPPPPDSTTRTMVEMLAKQSQEDRRATLDALSKLAEARGSGGGAGGNGSGFGQGFELGTMMAAATQNDPLALMAQTFMQAHGMAPPGGGQSPPTNGAAG